MRHHYKLFALLAVVCLLLATMASASVPRRISYQGKATDASGNPVPDGTYPAKFLIWDHPTAGSLRWSEVGVNVTTAGGLFSCMIGGVNPIPDSLFAKYDSLYLQVNFNNQTLLPRTSLVSTGYAFRVNSVDGASGGTITGKLTISGTTVCWIDPNTTGFNSVYFPTDGINAREIYDEPGIAQTVNIPAAPIALSTGATLTEVLSVNITIPAAGYILVEAQADVANNGAGISYLQIDEALTNGYFHVSRAMAGSPSSYLYVTLNCHRYYYKSAGTYTFRLGGHTTVAGGEGHVERTQLRATYFPTSYGTVETVVSGHEASQFEKATATQSDGQTSYTVDLRELELKAAKAEATAERARAEAEKAQNELLKAKNELKDSDK